MPKLELGVFAYRKGQTLYVADDSVSHVDVIRTAHTVIELVHQFACLFVIHLKTFLTGHISRVHDVNTFFE